MNRFRHPDHLVVIKYVPTVGDSKRAIDEYVSELFCGGRVSFRFFSPLLGLSLTHQYGLPFIEHDEHI